MIWNLNRVTFGAARANLIEGNGTGTNKREWGVRVIWREKYTLNSEIQKATKNEKAFWVMFTHVIIHLSDNIFLITWNSACDELNTFPSCLIFSNAKQLANGIHKQRASEEHIYISKQDTENHVVSQILSNIHK